MQIDELLYTWPEAKLQLNNEIHAAPLVAGGVWCTRRKPYLLLDRGSHHPPGHRKSRQAKTRRGSATLSTMPMFTLAGVAVVRAA